MCVGKETSISLVDRPIRCGASCKVQVFRAAFADQNKSADITDVQSQYWSFSSAHDESLASVASLAHDIWNKAVVHKLSGTPDCPEQ
jgi:hypothetical protein